MLSRIAPVVAMVMVLGAVTSAATVDFVAQMAIDRPIGSAANMRDSQGIGFVPGDYFGAGQADRLVLVNNNNFVNQRYISYWQVDQVGPGSLALSEVQTVTADNGVVAFGWNGGVSFVEDPVNPHLLLAPYYWGFDSMMATIDLGLDMTTYNLLQVDRPGGGDYTRTIAWDPTRDAGADHAFVYGGEQGGGKLTITAAYVGGYPPTSTTGTSGYSDPAAITGVVNGRTWSATTDSFFAAVGTTLYEIDAAGVLIGTTDMSAWLEADEVITGLANDDERGYLWVFSNEDKVSGHVTAFAVPEPAALVLLAMGGVAVLGRRR